MRFTIRQVMVVVVVVALILAISIETAGMRQRSLDYQLRSLDHGLSAMRYDGRGLPSCWGPFELPSLVRNPRRSAYHTAMSRKWANAAEHPWFSLEPDPPEPD